MTSSRLREYGNGAKGFTEPSLNNFTFAAKLAYNGIRARDPRICADYGYFGSGDRE